MLEQQNADLEEEKWEVQVSLNSCNNQVADLEVSIVEKEKENFALREKQEGNHVERLASKDEEINNKETEIESLKSEMRSKDEEINMLCGLNTQLHTQVDKLKEAYSNMELSVVSMNTAYPQD